MTCDTIENFNSQEAPIYNLKVKLIERTAPLQEDVRKTRIIADRILSIETP